MEAMAEANPVEYRNPAGVSLPKGEYSHAAILQTSDVRLCFIGGQVGYDHDGEVALDFESQMETTFENLRTVLAGVGARFSSVVQLTTYLTSETYIDRYFATRKALFPRLFGEGNYPPNALIVVQGLARPALLIEVQAVAAVAAS